MTRIPLLVICCITLFVVVAEKLCGTDTYFAAAVGVIFIAVGITYNVFGGLKSISGLLFAEFALRTIVISQFLKIFFREPADLNLEAAHLTITLYFIFYCSLVLFSVFFARLRLPLPRPIEPRTESQARALYLISLAGGAIGTLLFDIQTLNPVGEQHLTLSHGIGLALSNLLFLAVVLAIDEKIRTSGGRHSLGWGAVIAIFIIWISALVTTSREMVLGSVVLYGVVCYFRGYRFKKRHMAGAIGFGLFFFFVFSPFELYTRTLVTNEYFSDRAASALQLLEQHPNLRTITSTVENEGGWGEGRTGYISGTKSNVLQRPTLIWSDSTLISACASGLRYGWTSIKIDFLYSVPRLISPNKPDDDASGYVGRIAGLNPDDITDTKSSMSAISDSFAGFGIPGVIILAIFIIPAFLAVYSSVFDPKTVWGTVALALAIPTFGEWRTGQFLIYIFYEPLYLIGLSWLLAAIAQLIPMGGEAELPSLRVTAQTSSFP